MKIQVLDNHIDDAISHLQLVVNLLKTRPLEADFFRGIINRIESEQKRIHRQVAREEIK